MKECWTCGKELEGEEGIIVEDENKLSQSVFCEECYRKWESKRMRDSDDKESA